MKKFITLLFALVSLCHLVVSAQKKYEITIEKTDGSETIIRVEDIARTYFRERGKTYTSCPDANHPHLIDLGLPSGTKWACCNLGASAPEDYGNYYAWGETEPKSIYHWDTYQYGSSASTMVIIGPDIAGTKYDAATANWGSPWCMPSLEQILELHGCSSIWTTQNGVNGRMFTGPNGGTIFLPAAGYRFDDELRKLDTEGNYWSSTFDESDPFPYWVYELVCIPSSAAYSSHTRWCGLSVRPVR